MAQKGYTTKAILENYLLQNIDDSFDTQINLWIEGVENIIDQATGRNFIADASASARLFDGNGKQELFIDECVAISLVELSSDRWGDSFETILSTGLSKYIPQPNNYAAKKYPISSILLRDQWWYKGIQNCRITAKWGYSAEVPKDIQFVATVFLAGIINDQRQGGAEIKSEKIGNYSVTYNSDSDRNSWSDFANANNILNTYKRLMI